MSIKVCAGPYMLSTPDGTAMARHWYPRVVAEAFLESKKDGPISRAPDPVTMIEGDLSWFNNTSDPLMIEVTVLRAPRSMVAQSPGTVIMRDAWSHAVGVSPTADFPTTLQDACGGKLQIDRSSVSAKDIEYGRAFHDFDSNRVLVPVGRVDPGESMHFRYRATVQTPGVWTTPTEFDPVWEAHANWTRLIAVSEPVGSL